MKPLAFVFRDYPKLYTIRVKLYNELNITIRLLIFILLDHVILGFTVNISHDPKLFLKKSKIFSNQKLKNIIYLYMAIIKEMGSLFLRTKKAVAETDIIEGKRELLIDVKTIEDELTSIYEDLKKLNGEIKEFKVDSKSDQEFIAKKIIDSIDVYLFNRREYYARFQDKSDYNSIISKNSFKYNTVAQRYLKEYKSLLDFISFNEEKNIGNSSGPNRYSNRQSSGLGNIYIKTKIDEIEAAIDNSLLDIIKYVQTGHQWYVKEYEESE